MIVSYKPFESKSGFTSPGFTVNELGDLVALSVDAQELKLNHTSVLTSTTLGSSVVNSSLTSVGTLLGLLVNGTSPISITSSGSITITSGTVGAINNMNIGNITPASGTFTTATATTVVANTITANTDLFVGTTNVKSYAAAIAVALS